MSERFRTLHFIRHGQYSTSPDGGILTALGRKQMRRTGRHLCNWDISSLHSSELSRARESADIVGHELGGMRSHRNEKLNEMVPTAIPNRKVPLAARKLARENLDSILERYFRPSRSQRHDVIVCHGNLIRALLCKTLGIRLSTWKRLDIHNGAVTRFKVLPDGETRLISFNDYGHLPAPFVTET